MTCCVLGQTLGIFTNVCHGLLSPIKHLIQHHSIHISTHIVPIKAAHRVAVIVFFAWSHPKFSSVLHLEDASCSLAMACATDALNDHKIRMAAMICTCLHCLKQVNSSPYRSHMTCTAVLTSFPHPTQDKKLFIIYNVTDVGDFSWAIYIIICKDKPKKTYGTSNQACQKAWTAGPHS